MKQLGFQKCFVLGQCLEWVMCLVYILTIPIRRKFLFNEGNNVLVEHVLKLCSIS